MKALHSILVGAALVQSMTFPGYLQGAAHRDGAFEFWHNTSSEVLPLSLGTRLYGRMGAGPFLAPTIAWNGASMAFPALLPPDLLFGDGFFFSDATYTNDVDAGEFFSLVAAPLSADGLANGATNVTSEPMPIYAELASSFAPPCPSPGPPPAARSTVAALVEDDCLDCPGKNCTEAVRDDIEQIIRQLRDAKLLDEAFLLEQMLSKGHFVVDTEGKHTRTTECEIGFGKVLLDSTPTLFISPAILCKTNAALELALLAGICAVQWENPVLRRNDDISAEAAFLIFVAAIGRDALLEAKKILEALHKPLAAVEGPFPIVSCLFDALCKAAKYKGARSDEAEEMAREIKRVLQKVRDLNKEFEKLTPEQQEAIVKAMIDKFTAIIVAIKARNWVLLEALGIPRACIDPVLMRMADAYDLSTGSPPGKPDIGKMDQNQTQDAVIPIEMEHTVLLLPGGEGFEFGAPIPVPLPGGPHVAAGLGNTVTCSGETYVAVVGTRSNGVNLIVRNESSFAAESLPGPLEVLDLLSVDVDGDGDVELIALIGPSNAPAIVMFSRTDACFLWELSAPLPCKPGAVFLASGDWNSDGKVDVAVAGAGFNDLYHQVNWEPGEPPWQLSASLPGVSKPTAIQALDIDGDRRLDLVVSDFEQSRVQVWLNAAPGGMRSGNVLSFPEPVTALVVSDLDGNGIPDVLAGMGESARLALQMNPLWDSPPAELAAVMETVFLDLKFPATQLLMRDMDGDGDRDVMVTTTGGVQFLQRYFSAPVVECALRIPTIRVTAGTLVIGRTDVDPTILPGPFKLVYRDRLQDEWRPVPPGDVLSTSGNEWTLRRPTEGFRVFRVMAE